MELLPIIVIIQTNIWVSVYFYSSPINVVMQEADGVDGTEM